MLKRLLVANVLIACFYTAVLFVIVYASAWQNLSTSYQNFPRQWETYYVVQVTIEAVQEYQKKHGKLPHDLRDKEITERVWMPNNLDVGLGPLDAWGRPLHYEIQGDKFAILSYGRDGLPGGAGLDADLGGPALKGSFILSNAPNVGPLQPPTFEQFLTIRDVHEIYGNSVVMWGILCGVLVFGLMLLSSWGLWWMALRDLSRRLAGYIVTLSPRSEEKQRADARLISGYAAVFALFDPQATRAARIGSLLTLCTSTVVMALMSMVFAFFITIVHIRTGH
jgi:hypothetical protein